LLLTKISSWEQTQVHGFIIVATILAMFAPWKWVGIAMLCCSALHNTTQHRYCKILRQKNSNAWKESNQSHPSSSIQVISQ